MTNIKEKHLRYIDKIFRSKNYAPYLYEEAYDECITSLLNADKKYDSSKGASFETWIRNPLHWSINKPYRSRFHEKSRYLAKQFKHNIVPLRYAELDSTKLNPLSLLTTEEDNKKIDKAISRLPDLNKNIIVSVFWNRTPITTIAKSIDLPHQKVRLILKHTLQTLKTDLQTLNES